MMRLRALRLADVGRFSRPVAVEGFGDGLNVLSGPNEMGKSTLLRALEALLTYEHKSNHADVRKLMPHAGGAPLIEAEFEAEGRLWRLRKQFLSGRAASLLDVTTGQVLKNADAETRLAAIRNGNFNGNRFGLLWLKQGDFTAPVDGDGGVAALIAGEVEAVSLDARAKEIQARIRKDLFELQTEKTSKAKGAWAAAQAANKIAAARLEAAEASARKQIERLDGMARLVAERAALLSPEQVAARADTVTTATKRLAEAEDARKQRSDAARALAAAVTALQSAELQAKSLADDIAALDRLTHEHETAGETGADLQRRLDACAADQTTARVTVERIAALLATIDRDLLAANAAAEAQKAAVERDRLAICIADVRATLASRDTAHAEAIVLANVTAIRVKALHTALAELASLEAALAAVVPEVSIALDPAAAGRIVVDGHALAASATFNPDTPLTIEIPGVGRITIAPNPATVGATQRAAREARRAEIETAYATLGVATVADAEARLAAKQQAEATAREAAIKAKALAPLGPDALITEHASASQRAAAATADFDATAIELLQASRASQAEALNQAKAAEEKLRQTHHALSIEAARHEAASQSRTQQIATLDAKLGEGAKRRADSDAMAEVLGRLRAEHNAAKSAADAWASHPDADRVEHLAAARQAAEHAIKMVDDRRVELEKAVFGLESELRTAGDEDVETELDSARAAAIQTAAHLAEIEAEVKALNLLAQEFQAIADAGRRELSGPILKRIQPYLAQLFPDAALELGDKLMPAHLLRNGQPEAHDQLSRGTQEQIAILVRLGLAHLLADKGAGVPLILDDALVYADDRRIAQMFAALQDASRLHQVIVLNCREQTFAALAQAPGATTLSFKPWVVPAALAA